MKLYYFFKGRVALYAILKSMGIKEGDEVILPGFSCVVVPNAIIYLGAKPIYVDIEPTTYNIDPDKIEEKITVDTKAIIAQHTFGIPADMNKITAIAKRHNLYVIEDSCHSVGSRFKGQEVGSFGDAAFFSSQWSKPVTTGLGGWAMINNFLLFQNMEGVYQELKSPSLRESLLLRLQYHIYSAVFRPSLFWTIQSTYRMLSRYGITIGSSTNEELECRMPDGYEKKMTQWQRNMLARKLGEIERLNSHRREMASLYENLLKNKGMQSVNLPDEYDPTFLRYPVLVKNKRDVLVAAKKRRIELGDWFLSPVHPNLEQWEKEGYQRGMCPIGEHICKHIINLPTHLGINVEEAERIVEFISEFRE